MLNKGRELGDLYIEPRRFLETPRIGKRPRQVKAVSDKVVCEAVPSLFALMPAEFRLLFSWCSAQGSRAQADDGRGQVPGSTRDRANGPCKYLARGVLCLLTVDGA